MVRQADWVESTFGRFGWREAPRRPGAIEILGEWERTNIVSFAPPLALRGPGGKPVKEIRCHRLVVTPLRRTLIELQRRELGHLINTFDGCFVPRHTRWDTDHPLSRHTWGIAVDVNARLFPFGSRAKQNEHLVAAFRRQGFASGGEWRNPDPMHFEMVKLPQLADDLEILLNGERLTCGFMQQGRAMAPVREIAEALGATVEARLEEGEVEIIHSQRGDLL
jgi:hypothetical protein